MSIHFRPDADFTRIIELTPALRRRIEATVEQLLSILDQFDGDENLEDGGESEASLGWTERGPNAGRFDFQDCELDDAEYEDGADCEPTLGWTNDGYMGMTFEADERELEEA